MSDKEIVRLLAQIERRLRKIQQVVAPDSDLSIAEAAPAPEAVELVECVPSAVNVSVTKDGFISGSDSFTGEPLASEAGVGAYIRGRNDEAKRCSDLCCGPAGHPAGRASSQAGLAAIRRV